MKRMPRGGARVSRRSFGSLQYDENVSTDQGVAVIELRSANSEANVQAAEPKFYTRRQDRLAIPTPQRGRQSSTPRISVDLCEELLTPNNAPAVDEKFEQSSIQERVVGFFQRPEMMKLALDTVTRVVPIVGFLSLAALFWIQADKGFDETLLWYCKVLMTCLGVTMVISGRLTMSDMKLKHPKYVLAKNYSLHVSMLVLAGVGNILAIHHTHELLRNEATILEDYLRSTNQSGVVGFLINRNMCCGLNSVADYEIWKMDPPESCHEHAETGCLKLLHSKVGDHCALLIVTSFAQSLTTLLSSLLHGCSLARRIVTNMQDHDNSRPSVNSRHLPLHRPESGPAAKKVASAKILQQQQQQREAMTRSRCDSATSHITPSTSMRPSISSPTPAGHDF